MKLKQPKNNNYCVTIVEIDSIVPLDNCDNVQHAIILGNKVIVGKDINKGDVGLYFPLETQLSKEYLSVNNLYRNKDLNINKGKAGYFEENGRIRCVKFRGNDSEGLFMPVDSLINLLETYGEYEESTLEDLLIGDEFDELEGIPICNKYIPKNTKTQGLPGDKSRKGKNNKQLISKLIDNQFRFHQDTMCVDFYRNVRSFIG